jgi:hypothetical protein
VQPGAAHDDLSSHRFFCRIATCRVESLGQKGSAFEIVGHSRADEFF